MSRGDPEVSIVGVDTGGTFTDLAGWIGGAWRRLKVPSTPDDPSRAVIAGLRRILEEGAPENPHVVHGSTVATNALLERTGARVALVTNAGFEDLLVIGRQARPSLYALENRRPPPLVTGDRRVGIKGRIGPDGGIEEALSPEELAGLADRVEGAESVVVCLLHGYAAPEEERRVADALARLDVPVTRAADLVPEFREYERLSTAVVNAYVMPLMGRYLWALERELAEAGVSVMGSGGGWLSIARASAEPVRTVLSGPVGGVLGARAAAAHVGVDCILTLDMGGTSTDVAVCPGEPLRTRAFSIGGQPLAIDVLDVHTIGSGGGSIAWVDPAGALRVGPRSAGANPGPACYGNGGTYATVTDANVVLGRLPANAFSIGGGALDAAASHDVLSALATQLGTDAETTALAVVDVVDAAMEAALRLVSVERGYDPADFALVPFGGAAGLHAASLADRIGAQRILLPTDPGLLSACGMVVAPARTDASRSVLWIAGPDVVEPVRKALAELDAEARAALAADGIPSDRISSRSWIDARYVGQSHELTVAAEGWVERFHAAHEAAFGYRRAENPVQAVTLRVEAIAEPTAPVPPAGEAVDRSRRTDREAHATRVRWGADEVGAEVVRREDLAPGDAVAGPAILTEYSSTTWLPPGWGGLVLPGGAVELRRRTAANSAPTAG